MALTFGRSVERVPGEHVRAFIFQLQPSQYPALYILDPQMAKHRMDYRHTLRC